MDSPFWMAVALLALAIGFLFVAWRGTGARRGTAAKADDRRRSLIGSIGSGLLSGAAVGFTLFAFQNAVAHSDQKAQQRQESHQRQSDARQGLLLALNMGPDLRGIDATTLDDLVNAAIAPAAADAQSGSGGVLPQGTASSRDLCEDKQAPQRRPESNVLKNIRLRAKRSTSRTSAG
jgi:hypothetical protein